MILGGVVAICALTMKMDLLGYDSYFPAYDNLQGVVINVSNLSYPRRSIFMVSAQIATTPPRIISCTFLRKNLRKSIS